MPKLFPIHIEVEELAVGKVMRMLNGMPGVAKFHLDLDRGKSSGTNGSGGGKGSGTPRGPRKLFEKTGEEYVLELLTRSKGPMTTGQLREAFIEQERSPSSINSCIHTMMKKGDVVSTPDGYNLSKKMRDRLRHRLANKKKVKK